MQKAAYAADPDVTPGATVGASNLPHVAHAGAGLMMAIVQATMYNMLPKDPGQRWESTAATVTEIKSNSFVPGQIECRRDNCEVCAEVNKKLSAV